MIVEFLPKVYQPSLKAPCPILSQIPSPHPYSRVAPGNPFLLQHSQVSRTSTAVSFLQQPTYPPAFLSGLQNRWGPLLPPTTCRGKEVQELVFNLRTTDILEDIFLTKTHSWLCFSFLYPLELFNVHLRSLNEEVEVTKWAPGSGFLLSHFPKSLFSHL